MKTLIAVIVGIIVLAGGWYVYNTYFSSPLQPDSIMNETGSVGGTNTTNPGDSGTGVGVDVGVEVGGAAASAEVALSSSGFSPKTVTIKKGGTVTWTNSRGGQMWIASAQHPTHSGYSGTTLAEHCAAADNTAFDECKTGSTYTFTFDKVGTWNYHNHSNTSQFGTVVVVE